MKDHHSNTRTDMPCTALYNIVWGPKELTQWMRWADIFDPGMAIGIPREVALNFSSDKTIEDAGAFIKTLVEAYEWSLRNIWFCHLVGIDRKIAFEYNLTILPYWSSTVRQISDGQKHGLLRDYIESLGLQVETTEDMFIKQIHFK